ncbi:hypothetical protein SBA3_2400008 [Candidatus Sulfopaludibacter sp. SbA3]|nr:hypothetical protein SBA3_2400008 [Candidatus Sulfopaludibacter sp. SbA3]
MRPSGGAESPSMSAGDLLSVDTNVLSHDTSEFNVVATAKIGALRHVSRHFSCTSSR